MTNEGFTRQQLESMEDEYYNKLEHGARNRCWHTNDSGEPDSFCGCTGVKPNMLQRWIDLANAITTELIHMEESRADFSECVTIIQIMNEV